MRGIFIKVSLLLLLANVAIAFVWPKVLYSLIIIVPLVLQGAIDMTQKKHAIRRNFPLLGHFRYWFEALRPEINQYFVESNLDGVPFSREQRSVVYQRSKKELDTLPFGTQKQVYAEGYEWATHSLVPQHVDPGSLRVNFGGPDCAHPYSASVLNISAMSYGALSQNAILALNRGAKLGNFAHNTGEGGLSPYHLQPGGDLIWQIGTGYFGCRSKTGDFDPILFSEKARLPQVKMIEIKLSQGAKPSHGGILPAAKVTEEISRIRNVPIGFDVISPAAHNTFSTPIGLLEWVAKLRELSGGKPVGFKLCIGKRREFMAVVKAMLKTGITPDFVTVDGGEGGTGAAPIEFSNSIGFPLNEALAFVHSTLLGVDLRDRIRIIASGKTVTGFDMISRFALGADACNSARAMMMALGCIQALRCNTNKCPTGVSTQDPDLAAGLNVGDKTTRVANFQRETVKSAAELIGAMGLKHTDDLKPWHIFRRVGIAEIRHLGQIYQFLEKGDLLKEPLPSTFVRAFEGATAESFLHV